MKYTYVATLKNGIIVEGDYESNGESTKSINVEGASSSNPVVSVRIQQKAPTVDELAKLKSVCKHCNSRLTQTSPYGAWVDKLECPGCNAKVLVQYHDRMSGCLVDYTIVIIKDGIMEQIDVPFKD